MIKMKSSRVRLIASLSCLAVPALLTAGCATAANQARENSLAAAGFIDRPANTPERQAMLANLPPHRFLRRVHDDIVHYVYADPTGCNCLYVGTQEAYGRYQRQQQRQNIANQNALAADEYSNASWNWGAWGGGFGRRWRGGPGFGW